MKTRILPLSLALTCLLSLTALAAPAESAAYPDADKIAYKEAVTALSQMGVISGREDGSFDPQGLVTRAECAKLLSALRFGGELENVPKQAEGSPFSDTEGHWAEVYISDCTQRGILNGRGEDIFDPDANVTGLELAKMALATLGYDPVAYLLTGPEWNSSTERLALHVCSPSLYEGLGEDVEVSEPITREVAAQILYNTLYNGVKEAIGHTDPTTGETVNTYISKRNEEGKIVPFYSVYFDAAKWEALSAR